MKDLTFDDIYNRYSILNFEYNFLLQEAEADPYSNDLDYQLEYLSFRINNLRSLIACILEIDTICHDRGIKMNS